MMPRCGRCPVLDGACLARRLNVPRICEVDAYLPHLERWGAEGGPDGDREAAAAPALVLAGFAPCAHRSGKWNCGGDLVASCRLGLGEKGGIVDPDDCEGCPRLETPS